jgi:hypothetical protein
VDVDVVFGLLGVGDEGLDEELTKDTSDGLNLDILAGTSLNPLASLGPGLVQSEETALTTSLDQLVGFGDELGAGSQQPRVEDLGLVEDVLDGGIFGEVEGGQTRRRVVSGGGRQRSRLNDGGTSEVVVEDGLAIGFEDRLGGHGVRGGAIGMGERIGRMKRSEKEKEKV